MFIVDIKCNKKYVQNEMMVVCVCARERKKASQFLPSSLILIVSTCFEWFISLYVYALDSHSNTHTHTCKSNAKIYLHFSALVSLGMLNAQ